MVASTVTTTTAIINSSTGPNTNNGNNNNNNNNRNSKPTTPENNPPLLVSLESAAARIANGSKDGYGYDDYGYNDDNDFLNHRLKYPHPGLRQQASPVTKFGENLEIVVDHLLRSMETNATTPVQYGIDARIIILRGDSSPHQGHRDGGRDVDRDNTPIVFVNPNILARSSEDKMVSWTEYCLTVGGTDIVWPEGEAPRASAPWSTVPNRVASADAATANANNAGADAFLRIDLLRDETVEVAAQDYRTGRPIRMTLRGEASRAFQHELDHLNGILIVDHASGLDDLPPVVAFLEESDHEKRQKQAFARTTYQGNGPLYY